MADVAEVVVRATPEGVNETTDELDEMSGKVSESADEMAEQSEEMSGLAESFSGAMTAVVGGLAVASAGLLSQVPVIGEAMSGLGAIVDALAFKMDGVLRPVLGPISNFFFDIADAIMRMNGPMGTLIGFVATLGALLTTAFGVLVPFVGAATAWAATFGKVAAAIKFIVGGLATLLGISALAAGILLAIVAAGLILAYVFRDEITSAIGDAIQWLKDITNEFTTMVSNAKEWGGDLLSGFVDSVVDFAGSVPQKIRNFVSDVEDKFDGLVSDAKDWGSDLLSGFITGIENKIEDVKTAVKNFAGAVRDRMPGSNAETGPLSDLKESGQALPQTFAKGISANSGVSLKATEDALNGPDDFIGSVGGGSGNVYLDGKRVDDNQGRFRKDALTKRGG